MFLAPGQVTFKPAQLILREGVGLNVWDRVPLTIT